MVEVLFYSPVKDMKLFEYTGFYQLDKKAMENMGWHVTFTNNWRDVLTRSYDILYTYFWSYSTLAIILARIRGKQIISTGGADLLDPIYAAQHGKKQALLHASMFRIAALFTNVILAVSRSDAVNMRRLMGSGRKLLYSPHPVIFYPRQAIRRRMQVSTVAWMSTVSNVQRKGLDRLMRVVKHLNTFDEFRGLELMIMGTEGEGSDYLRRIQAEEDIDGVTFLGVVDEATKQRILGESLFYGQLSEFEGFGLAALEGLAAGCIVLHSGRGGLEGVVGPFGIQVDLRQSDLEIAEAIRAAYGAYRIDADELRGHLAQFDISARAKAIAQAASKR